MTWNAPDPDSASAQTEYASVPMELLTGAGFTARDLALCSSDEARSLLSASDAVAWKILPLALQRGPSGVILHLAAESDEGDVQKKVKFIAGIDAIISKVPGDVLREAIPKAYYGSDAHLQPHLHIVSASRHSLKKLERQEQAPPILHGDAAQFITALLEYASARGASDLHLAPGREGVVIKIRIDGDLMILERNPYALALHDQVVSRLKVVSRLDISQRMLPQDGAFSFEVGGVRVHARIGTLPSVYGESVVIRFLRDQSIPQLTLLGVEPNGYEIIKDAIGASEGLILLTGPTGSGKTTTMYSVVTELEKRGRNVVTVEDPVELRVPGVVQVQVALEQGLDYPRAIRSVLRHDPDVLLVGEMRDGVSASIALDAASTGHLTLSSLHIGSSLHVFTRMEALGVSRARVVPALSLVINQRLVPMLCSRCKVIDSSKPRGCYGPVYMSRGCAQCAERGYVGRALVTELLDLRSNRAKEVCYVAKNAQELLELLPADAFIPWTESLDFHLKKGAISARQVEEFVQEEMV